MAWIPNNGPYGHEAPRTVSPAASTNSESIALALEKRVEGWNASARSEADPWAEIVAMARAYPWRHCPHESCYGPDGEWEHCLRDDLE